MSEPAAPPVAQTVTSGTLLRQARTAHGLHIAALAATVKVPQRKLEALESDRLDELPDAAFARALAKKVCHVLKIDAEPILALMPQPPETPRRGASRTHIGGQGMASSDFSARTGITADLTHQVWGIVLHSRR